MFPIDMNNFIEEFSSGNLAFLICASICNGTLLLFASMKFLLALQQSGYRGKKYFKWLASPETPYLSRLMLLCLLGFLFFLVLNITFSSMVAENVVSYIGFASYLLFIIAYINTERNVNAKVPLRKTKRLVRLCVTFAVMLAVVTFGLFMLLDYLAYLIGDSVVALFRYSIICGMPILSPYILFISYCINEPVEELIKRHYINIAKQKLAKSNVIKIGITGSYAKTSVKEILRTILSQKYRVLATPLSYNTPLGIAVSLKKLDSTHDVFIAEMGARYKGDIKELSKIVKPSYALLTGINNQHLETFGSKENILDTKYELFAMLDKNGKAFFSADSDGSIELYDRFDGEKRLAGISNFAVENDKTIAYASDITTNERGMSFTLNIRGETPVKCNTVLLGKHNVSNVCLASAVAYDLGLTVQEIAQGINRIHSVGHRLELVPNNRNIVIIDDSYNGNVDGVKAAMEVLSTFSGRKIVLTPGLIELGKMENIANLEMGETLAKYADYVIIIGKHNAEMLINGLNSGGMDKNNISFAKTLNKGNELLNSMVKENDVVLFENDLPDNYS